MIIFSYAEKEITFLTALPEYWKKTGSFLEIR